jgi:hypothetical protein
MLTFSELFNENQQFPASFRLILKLAEFCQLLFLGLLIDIEGGVISYANVKFPELAE